MTDETRDSEAGTAVQGPADAPVAQTVRGSAPLADHSPSKTSVADLVLNGFPVVAFLASAAMLASAHAFETFGKLYPCPLCLKQREVYWVAGTVALIAFAARYTPWHARLGRPFALLLGAIFLYGAGLAAYHAGAEWKWWPGPTTCSAGATAAAGDLVAMLKGAAIETPACDKAAWIFLGISMAGWNALISLGLAVAALAAGLRKTETIR